MGRDKAKDDTMFNCSQEHELNLVANHYGVNKTKVYNFLVDKCKDKTIFNSTHLQVYKLIKAIFGYEIPVHN